MSETLKGHTHFSTKPPFGEGSRGGGGGGGGPQGLEKDNFKLVGPCRILTRLAEARACVPVGGCSGGIHN